MNPDEKMSNKVRVEYKPLSQCLAVIRTSIRNRNIYIYIYQQKTYTWNIKEATALRMFNLRMKVCCGFVCDLTLKWHSIVIFWLALLVISERKVTCDNPKNKTSNALLLHISCN